MLHLDIHKILSDRQKCVEKMLSVFIFLLTEKTNSFKLRTFYYCAGSKIEHFCDELEHN